MPPTPEVTAEILAEFKRTRSPFKTANAVGVDVAVVWAVIDSNKDKVGAFEERYGGRGRPELEQFIVASRRAMAGVWDNDSTEIRDARAAYEAGTHEMATGRDGPWLILYCIPRRYPATGRAGYFTPENS